MDEVLKFISAVKTAPRVLRYLSAHPAARGRPVAPLWKYASWQLRKRIQRRPVTIDVFDGARLRCYPDSTSTSSVIYLGWPDWHEMHFLRSVLAPGDGFLDVGANVGVYSVLASGRIKPGGRIMAVEADPIAAERLQDNLRLNGFGIDSMRQVAVGDRAGTCRFDVGLDSVGGVLDRPASRGADVELCRLDDIVVKPEQFAVGKMDIEGYELTAFQGATRLLSAASPRCWLVETNRASERYEGTRAPLQAFLAGFGFRLFEVCEQGQVLRPVPTGGPYPENSLAVGDLEWLVKRLPGLKVLGA